MDVRNNRTNERVGGYDMLFDLLRHPIFKLSQSKVVVLSCDAPYWFNKKRAEQNASIALASLSVNIRDMNASFDQGLPPPCVTDIKLTDKQVNDIATCAAESEKNRPFLLTYIGNWRSEGPPSFHARGKLHQFHDNNKTFILRYFLDEFKESAIGNMSFPEIMANSLFAAAPRYVLFSECH